MIAKWIQRESHVSTLLSQIKYSAEKEMSKDVFPTGLLMIKEGEERKMDLMENPRKDEKIKKHPIKKQILQHSDFLELFYQS